MSTPSRREFFTYAAAATLASTLPASAHTKKDESKKDRPLVVDVVGPMALRWSGENFELWMPDLSSGKNPHEAGIMTPVTSFELLRGNYQITGPSPAAAGSKLTPHGTGGGEIYEGHPSDYSTPNRYIYMSLPKPYQIVVLDPVPARIYRKASELAKMSSRLYATGVRLLYEKANEPRLVDGKGVASIMPDGKIPFDPDQQEIQLNMLIGYAPYYTNDPDHTDAKNSFNAISKLFGLDLQVEFDETQLNAFIRRAGNEKEPIRPFQDCKSLAIGVGG